MADGSLGIAVAVVGLLRGSEWLGYKVTVVIFRAAPMLVRRYGKACVHWLRDWPARNRCQLL